MHAYKLCKHKLFLSIRHIYICSHWSSLFALDSCFVHCIIFDFHSTISIKKKKLEALTKNLELHIATDTSRKEVLRSIAMNREFWDLITKEELTAIFHELVEKVVCSVAEEVSERVVGQTQFFDAQLKI